MTVNKMKCWVKMFAEMNEIALKKCVLNGCWREMRGPNSDC